MHLIPIVRCQSGLLRGAKRQASGFSGGSALSLPSEHIVERFEVERGDQAGLAVPCSSFTPARTRKPRTKKRRMDAMPARWLSKRPVTKARTAGPRKAMAFPESA